MTSGTSVLEAGPRLACHCGGEIQLNDRCGRCNAVGDVCEPAWWLWFTDDRASPPCRRCMTCDRLVFQWHGNCPRCEKNNWSPRLTQVWIPAQWVPVDNVGAAALSNLNPAVEAEQNEAMRALSEWIEGAFDEPERG